METSDGTKSQSPQNSTNWFSKIFIWWTVDLFRKGYKRELINDDLFEPINSDCSKTLGDKLERAWQEQVDISKKNGCKPSLNKAIVKVFWLRFSIWGFFLGLNFIVMRPILPLALARFVAYFSGHERHGAALVEAHIMNLVVNVASFSITLLYHHIILGLFRVGMQLRIACCSLMYRKLLKLDVVSLNKTAAGQVINLMSNDVSRFDMALIHLHAIWAAPLLIVIVAYLVWQHIGWATVAGLSVMVFQAIFVQGYLTKLQTVYRGKVAKCTDERVQLMSELVGGVEVIKMYAWEAPFQKMVASLRKLEIGFITKATMIRGLSTAIAVFTERLILYSSLVAFVLLGGVLRADIAFSMLQYFHLLQFACNYTLPLAMALFGEASISIQRIEEFMHLEELDVSKQNDDTPVLNGSEKPAVEPTGVVLTKVSASWVAEPNVSTLQDVSLTIKPGDFCALVGPVGSGKTSLLQVLLGELPITQGSLSLGGARVSFASQEPWLFLGTVRQNILFGEPYDKERYKKVVTACALLKDFKLFPKNDATVVGERGVSLSGGQRARIGLARAVYRKADVYLLDDPLSAVDTHVGKQLLTDCIDGFLKHKTRILVTHQLHHLKTATNIVILRDGQIEVQGVFDEVSKNPLFSELLQEEHDEVDELELSPRSVVRQRTLSEQSTISSAISEAMSVRKDYEEEPETQELVEKGNISSSVYKDYFTAGGGWFMLIMTALGFIIAQVVTSMADLWVAYWTNNVEAEIAMNYNLTHTTINTTSSILQSNATSTESSLNETTTLFIIGTQSDSINASLNDSAKELVANYDQNEFYIYTWTVLLAGCMIFTTVRSLMFFWVCMTSSTKLHDSMFGSVLQATMHFFHTNPSGRILNRFSKDMGAVDEQLPRMMLESLQIFLIMFGILIMVAIVSPLMVLTAAVCAVFMVLLTKVYMRTAQSVKRLEGATRSPVFSHVSSSMAGLATVRAFDAQQMLTKQFDEHQDLHTSAWVTTLVTTSAFSIWLSIISGVFVAAVAYTLLLLDDGTTKAGDVGLAISQSLILTSMVQYGIKQMAQVIAQMTSVERIVQYTSLPLEHPLESPVGHRPPKDWPSRARVQFKNVYLRYAEGVEPVLRNLNITIESGWKVGVVGRTGAGKSSLISALFRLAVVDGDIIIDDIDIAKIGLRDLRRKLSIIPQEPVLFTASMRYNLDPFDKHTDADIWTALEDVELKGAVSALSQSVSGGGTNLSAGQRQLVCLARAALARNTLLVLDEATANVDPKTDSLIQKTIRSRFATCTVITVAHRLHTVADSDRVLVMDAGQVVQFDHPHLLLQDTQGTFAKMVEQMGPAAANALTQVSKQAYQQHIKWSVNLFKTGYERVLSNDDLFEPIDSDVSTTLGDKLEAAWQEQVEISKKNGSKPSLNKAIVKVFWLRFALWGLFYGLNFIVLRPVIPFALARFVAYFSGQERHGTPLVEAHIMNYVVNVAALSSVILQQHVALGLRRVGMQLRIACCSVMYRKLLKLDVVALKKTAAGQVVNLMSNDVKRFDQAPLYLHAIWVTPPMVIVVAYSVWQHIGWATIAGLMVIVFQSVAVQGYLSKQITVYRSKVAKHTDHRLQLMSELVGGVQVIKMYAWEVPFQKIVAAFRKLEITFITKASMVRSFSDAFSVFTKHLTLYSSLVKFVLLGGVLRAEIAFSLVQYFNMIDLVCNFFLPIALTMFGEATISIKRIEEFLHLGDLDEAKQKSLNGSYKPVAKPTGVVLTKVSASWVPDTTMSTLQDISLDIRPGEFCAVVGPVGSGKSSLLQVLLGELPLTQGSLSLGDARVSFASQEPWLFLGTVRQNILFGEPYDRDRYKEVVAVCALVRDFKLLPKNDSTVVGERGVSLSGGQRARIGLARAVYRKAELYLLDDPLSAVDTNVGKQLLTDCINGFLKHETRILVTHQLHHLKTATNIFIRRNGQIESQGVC